MKIRFSNITLSFTLGLSLLLSSCGTTSGADLSHQQDISKTPDITEKDIISPDEALRKENDGGKTEEAEEKKAEKISGDEIPQSPVNKEEAEPFTEPIVYDAPDQETDDVEQDHGKQEELVAEEAPQASPSPLITEQDGQQEQDLPYQRQEEFRNNPHEERTQDLATSEPEETDEEEQSDGQELTANENSQVENGSLYSFPDETDIFETPSVIVPSRSMTIKNNQYVDIIYPGSGWIYMGETESTQKFRYFGRKLGTTDTTFTLRSIKPGNTLLHFYKNDVLTAEYIDDYLQVEIENESATSNERATAPAYSQAVPPKQTRYATQLNGQDEIEDMNSNNGTTLSLQDGQTTESPSSGNISTAYTGDNGIRTVVQDAQAAAESQEPQDSSLQEENKQGTSSSSSAPISTDNSKNLLEQAKESLSAKNYELALEQVQSYLNTQSAKIDEALYIQGQILEADSSVRNIKSAIDSYDTLIKHYPTSHLWQAANKRKIYLNRYYVNIY